MALSAGFVAVGVARSAGDPYSRWILLGLLLSAAGDAFLLSDERRAFLGGLASASCSPTSPTRPPSRRSPARPSRRWPGSRSLTAAVLAWLWPRLGAMRIPVVGYAVAIGLMLWLASGVGRALVPAGALLFWLSDLTVAKRRFGPRSPLDRAVGWPLYFAGQYLLGLLGGQAGPSSGG